MVRLRHINKKSFKTHSSQGELPPEYVDEEDYVGGDGQEARQVEDPLNPLLHKIGQVEDPLNPLHSCIILFLFQNPWA